MSQYRTGTVGVTNGTPNVVGSGTAFLANVTVGGVFSISASGVPYIVGAVADDTHLTLTSNYAGSTLSGLSYSVTNSFTPNLSLPYPDQGDIDTATILKRMALLLDANTNLSTIDNETPAGTINGTDGTDGNAAFTLAYAPNPANSLMLFKTDVGTAVLMIAGVHYNLSTLTITYTSGNIPIAGMTHRAWYRK